MDDHEPSSQRPYWVGIVHALIRKGAWLGCFYIIYLCVLAAAGKDTSVLVDTIVDLKFDRWVAYVAAVLAGGGYLHERRLRQRAVREMSVHIRKLESKLLPERSSSGLLPSGEAKLEDQDD